MLLIVLVSDAAVAVVVVPELDKMELEERPLDETMAGEAELIELVELELFVLNAWLIELRELLNVYVEGFERKLLAVVVFVVDKVVTVIGGLVVVFVGCGGIKRFLIATKKKAKNDAYGFFSRPLTFDAKKYFFL